MVTKTHSLLLPLHTAKKRSSCTCFFLVCHSRDLHLLALFRLFSNFHLSLGDIFNFSVLYHTLSSFFHQAHTHTHSLSFLLCNTRGGGKFLKLFPQFSDLIFQINRSDLDPTYAHPRCIAEFNDHLTISILARQLNQRLLQKAAGKIASTLKFSTKSIYRAHSSSEERKNSRDLPGTKAQHQLIVGCAASDL